MTSNMKHSTIRKHRKKYVAKKIIYNIVDYPMLDNDYY